MSWYQIKETAAIIGAILSVISMAAICIAILVGIPTAAIVLIIEAIKS